MRQIGSQMRETLEESGMTLTVLLPETEEAILTTESGRHELWYQNDHYAGYVVEIDGVGYEFIHGLNEDEEAFYIPE